MERGAEAALPDSVTSKTVSYKPSRRVSPPSPLSPVLRVTCYHNYRVGSTSFPLVFYSIKSQMIMKPNHKPSWHLDG